METTEEPVLDPLNEMIIDRLLEAILNDQKHTVDNMTVALARRIREEDAASTM